LCCVLTGLTSTSTPPSRTPSLLPLLSLLMLAAARRRPIARAGTSRSAHYTTTRRRIMARAGLLGMFQGQVRPRDVPPLANHTHTTAARAPPIASRVCGVPGGEPGGCSTLRPDHSPEPQQQQQLTALACPRRLARSRLLAAARRLARRPPRRWH
jgi:MYXO-CTERM domain-containing protein